MKLRNVALKIVAIAADWQGIGPSVLVNMQLRLLGLLLALLNFVAALSATGSKLLVILEEESEKTKYSVFWKDLAGTYIFTKVCVIEPD